MGGSAEAWVAKQRDRWLSRGMGGKQRDEWLRSWMVNYAEGCVAKQRDGRLRICTVSYMQRDVYS
jgi:hypothetical protein